METMELEAIIDPILRRFNQQGIPMHWGDHPRIINKHLCITIHIIARYWTRHHQAAFEKLCQTAVNLATIFAYMVIPIYVDETVAEAILCQI